MSALPSPPSEAIDDSCLVPGETEDTVESAPVSSPPDRPGEETEESSAVHGETEDTIEALSSPPGKETERDPVQGEKEKRGLKSRMNSFLNQAIKLQKMIQSLSFSLGEQSRELKSKVQAFFQKQTKT